MFYAVILAHWITWRNYTHNSVIQRVKYITRFAGRISFYFWFVRLLSYSPRHKHIIFGLGYVRKPPFENGGFLLFAWFPYSCVFSCSCTKTTGSAFSLFSYCLDHCDIFVSIMWSKITTSPRENSEYLIDLYVVQFLSHQIESGTQSKQFDLLNQNIMKEKIISSHSEHENEWEKKEQHKLDHSNCCLVRLNNCCD